MQFAALGNVHRHACSQYLVHSLSKALAYITTLSANMPWILLRPASLSCIVYRTPLRSVTSAVVTAIACDDSPCIPNRRSRTDGTEAVPQTSDSTAQLELLLSDEVG